MNKLLVAGAALAALIGTPVLAADMALKAPPPPAPAPTWTGWYVGLNAGGEWNGSNNNISHTAAAGPCNAGFGGCAVVPNYSQTLAAGSTFGGLGTGHNGRFIGGGQVGYNWQPSASWVVGLEADIDGVAHNNNNNNGAAFASLTPNVNFPGFPEAYAATVTRQLDFLGTVRGRVGVLATPNFLLFATGGLAYGGVKSTTAEAATCCAGVGAVVLGAGGGSFSETRAGWTVGAGAEWKIDPRWSLVAQYLYYDLGTANYNTALNQICVGAGCAVPGGLFASTVGTTSVKYNGSVARGGVNLHF